MTADEAIESGKAAMAFTGDTVAVCVNTDALRALLAEIERLRAAQSGKRRVRAFAAQYQGDPIALTTIRATKAQSQVCVHASRPGWRVVPVEITWSEEGSDADE